MTKSIFLFKINDNFASLRNENNLDIILNIFLKTSSSNFFEEQFNLIIENIECDLIKNTLIKNLEARENLEILDNKLILHNKFKNNEETIEFYKNKIIIKINEEKSLFLELLSLYFSNLIAINLDEEKIYPLHLVKTSILV